VLDSGSFTGVWGDAGGEIVAWDADGTLQTLSPGSDKTRRVGHYEAVLDVAAGPGGEPVALVRSAPDRFDLVDAVDGAVLSDARIESAASLPALGTLSPSGTRALVAGADGQLQIFGVGEGPTPTGIALPSLLTDVVWASDERVILTSESERGQVFYLPRQEPLGHICWDVPRLQSVALDADGQTAACIGSNLNSLWNLPPGPRLRVLRESTVTRLQDRFASVQTKQARVKIYWHGTLGSGSTAWFTPSDSTVTALAFGPDGREVVIGSASGEVTLVEFAREDARIAVEWHVPDSAPVTAVGWQDGPVANTASGQTWTVPSCVSCATDTGLLDVARERFTGCFTERQIAWVIDAVRQRLGVKLCPPAGSVAEG
jgi:WD40 repeat protein